MSPVSRATTAGRVYLDIQRLARTTGRPTDELLRTYVLERFLWRVGHSRYRDRLILKGGMLMAVLGERRPTADVDMLARDLSNDLDSVSGVASEVISIKSDDGVEFMLDKLKVTTIRDDDVYPGVRVSVPARIDRARAVLQLDINVGDPVTPAPVNVEYPALLTDPFSIVGYPFETVIAEKVVTMLDRGDLNTRERDFADVYLLLNRLEIEGEVLGQALRATMRHRGSRPQPLGIVLAELGTLRQLNWRTYRATAGLEARIPLSYSETIEAIVSFADPAITGKVDGLTWEPLARRWV